MAFGFFILGVVNSPDSLYPTPSMETSKKARPSEPSSDPAPTDGATGNSATSGACTWRRWKKKRTRLASRVASDVASDVPTPACECRGD